MEPGPEIGSEIRTSVPRMTWALAGWARIGARPTIFDSGFNSAQPDVPVAESNVADTINRLNARRALDTDLGRTDESIALF